MHRKHRQPEDPIVLYQATYYSIVNINESFHSCLTCLPMVALFG